MKIDAGMSIVILTIIIIFIMIVIAVIVHYAKSMLQEKEKQDLRTNMLLMQAEVKKGLEEVCFRTVNLDKTKEEDITKINEIKQEYLDGILLKDSPTEVQEATKNVPEFEFDENSYYLDATTLSEIGIKEIDESINGYFIVKYDFSNANVEVINTKGYEGNFTLTNINKAVDGVS